MLPSQRSRLELCSHFLGHLFVCTIFVSTHTWRNSCGRRKSAETGVWAFGHFGRVRSQRSTARCWSGPRARRPRTGFRPSRLDWILQEILYLFLDGVQRPSRPINGVECHETTSFGTPPWTLGPHPHDPTCPAMLCAAGLLWLMAWRFPPPSNCTSDFLCDT